MAEVANRSDPLPTDGTCCAAVAAWPLTTAASRLLHDHDLAMIIGSIEFTLDVLNP